MENVPDLGEGQVAFGLLLQLVNLFHLQMFHGSHMSHQTRFGGAVKVAQNAVVGALLLLLNHHLHFLQVSEEDRGRLKLLASHVDLQFMRTVGDEVGGVASKLDGVDAGEKPEFPFIGRTSLLDVIDMAQTL